MKNEIILRRVSSKTFEVCNDVEIFGQWIPGGFHTDGASVPWLARLVITPFGVAFEAAIVHDYQLSKHGQYVNDRKKADDTFYWNLRKSGLSRFRARLCYAGVRAGSLLPFLRPGPVKD